jgi:Domain of unknown function (DUF4333)
VLRLGIVAVVAVFAFPVPGCGGTVIDDAKTADTIQSYLEKSLNEDVRSVDCPSDQPVDPKSTFDCEVALAGGEQKIVTVEIRNEDADFSIVDYKPEK